MVNRARTRRRPSSVYSVPVASPNATVASHQRTGLRTLVNARRKRPTSMIIPTNVTDMSSTSSRKSRRSSIASFSRLLDRMAPSSFDVLPRKVARSRRPGKTGVGSADLFEVWITGGGPYTPSSDRWRAEQMRASNPIDPFASSPDSKSFFIDFIESPPVTPRRESYISFSDSSTEIHTTFLSFLGRERPTSIQTMPLPSPRSSFHYHSTSHDKHDRSSILEEEESPSPTVDEIQVRDDAASIDWRQFHSDLLTDY